MFLLFVVVATVADANKNVKSANELALRIMGKAAQKISFEQLSGQQNADVFELESSDGKVIIRGNSANSMAGGLYHYLKYYI